MDKTCATGALWQVVMNFMHICQPLIIQHGRRPSSRLLGSMDKIGMTMAAAFWGCLEAGCGRRPQAAGVD